MCINYNMCHKKGNNGMDANRLYYEQEDYCSDINMVRFQEIIDNFYQSVGLNFDKLVTADINSDEPIEKFFYIRYLVMTVFKKYREEFFKVIEESGYNLNSELIDVMKLLGQQTNLRYAQDIIQYVLENPYVDEVMNEGPKITVKSERLGDRSFYSAKAYLSDNLPARTILMGNLDHRCHQISTELIEEVPNSKIVTSLLPSYFEGTYYHSYIKDEGMTIDAVNHIVMPHNSYDDLFQPQVITELSKNELYIEYLQAINDGYVKYSDGFYVPVAVALSKQLKGGK